MSKLEKVLNYASIHNTFYIKKIKENNIINPLSILEYPITTREMLQENKDLLLSPEYQTNLITNHLYIMSSSGTSGVPIETLWDPNQYGKSMLCLWRRRKRYYNISPNDKHIDFMLKYYNNLPTNDLKYSVSGNTISVNRLNLSSETVMQDFFKLMQAFQPVWLQLAPSVMEMIINHCEINNNSLPSSIRYVEFLSEILTPSMRIRTKQFIPNVEIANMYGSEEMNAIAYECPYGHMHIISDNVYAECYDGFSIQPCGAGTMILTNLNNIVNPLIRYDQGDRVILTPEIQCECGYRDKIISELIGRQSSIAHINGKTITTCDISDIMLIVSNRFNRPILKYKFIYETNSAKMTCYTVFNKSMLGWKNTIWKTINDLIVEKYGDIHITFVMDDYDKLAYKHDLFVVK